jgi:hypothetical protein
MLHLAQPQLYALPASYYPTHCRCDLAGRHANSALVQNLSVFAQRYIYARCVDRLNDFPFNQVVTTFSTAMHGAWVAVNAKRQELSAFSDYCDVPRDTTGWMEDCITPCIVKGMASTDAGPIYTNPGVVIRHTNGLDPVRSW